MEDLNEIIEQIGSLLNERNYYSIKELLKESEPADLSIILEEFPQKLATLFRLLPKDLAAEVFVEMETDSQESLLTLLTDSEMKEVMNELYIDDTVDIIEEMPANVVKRMLNNSDVETRKIINDILKYPTDSAGSLMTTEYVSLDEDITVEDALKRIRRTGVDKETIYTCYVTKPDRTLLGYITAKKLLLSDENMVISDIMETNVIFVNTHEDKEVVAKEMSKYDLLAIPVVDNENRLVGIITVDDAIDVIEEEATEDIEKMAAIIPSDKPYLATSPFEIWKNRIPWLILLMLTSTFTSQIITSFESKLASCVILTAFIPMIMGSGGNAGGQTSVTIIRGLATEEISLKDVFRILFKELRVSVLCGAVLGIATFLKMLLIDNLLLRNSEVTVNIAAVVSFTLIITIIVAKLVGCLLPLFAKRLGLDPAVMASPFITTIVDALSLLIYLGIAGALIPGLN
ncbi:MAG: magnesium transporter [Ruminococcaceae bacterium]|nr:magnesium transporter [Oscillospiraceae bacterium]